MWRLSGRSATIFPPLAGLLAAESTLWKTSDSSPRKLTEAFMGRIFGDHPSPVSKPSLRVMRPIPFTFLPWVGTKRDSLLHRWRTLRHQIAVRGSPRPTMGMRPPILPNSQTSCQQQLAAQPGRITVFPRRMRVDYEGVYSRK